MNKNKSNQMPTPSSLSPLGLRRELSRTGLGGCLFFFFFFFFFIFLFSFTLNAQTEIRIPFKNNSNVVDIDTLKGIKNKILRCEYDTLYIINRHGVDAFYKCIADLQRVKNLSGSLDSLTLNINTIHQDVNKMYYNISDVSSFIKKYNTETENNLTTLTLDNKALNENLLKVNEQLMEVKANLKAQQLKNIGNNLIWGAGGVTLGGLLVGLLLLK